MTDHLFLTGATGFIGIRLLRKWLESSTAHVTILTRPQEAISSNARLRALLPPPNPEMNNDKIWNRISLINGDVIFPQIGLKQTDCQRLVDSVTHIIHCAAAVRFNLELEEARKTNTHGTENIVALAKRCRNLRRLDYFSTAYVSGNRTDLIKEDELDQGQDHNNSYEKSKFEAEMIVTEAMKDLPIAIMRPSIVVCDSHTGELPTTSAFYRLLSLYSRGELKHLPGNSNTELDIVPAEYVVDGLFTISRNNDSIGRRFHLTAGPENMTRLENIIDLASQKFEREKLVLLPFTDYQRVAMAGTSGENRGAEMVNEIKMYIPYLNTNPCYDNTNTAKALKDTGIRVPPLENYFDKMIDFIRTNN